MKKIYLLANLSFVHGAKGDGAMSPALENTNGSIDASSSSLEAYIATYDMRGGCKRGRFHNNKQVLVCRSFILYSP